MFGTVDAMYSSVGANGRHAWVGKTLVSDLASSKKFVLVNLFDRLGYRAEAKDHAQFDSVWIVEEAVAEQGWRILIDSGIRLLKSQGQFFVRYVQNQYISIPALKGYLFRKYGIKISVIAEVIENGEIFTGFQVTREDHAMNSDKRWTFGILTQGTKPEMVARLCQTVRAHGGDDHEILIVGPRNEVYEQYNPTYINKRYSQKFSDICVKKNDLVRQAKHENLCILHDRYWLGEDFFSGFEEFGYDFDFITIRQQHQSGKNYPSYCAIDDKCHLIWGQIYECGNEHQTWNRHYLNGGFIVAKRELLKRIPFNDLIFHNQAEDVELAKQMECHSVVPRINRYSSAITDVPDHLTDVFHLDPETDYGRVFFPPAVPVANWIDSLRALNRKRLSNRNRKRQIRKWEEAAAQVARQSVAAQSAVRRQPSKKDGLNIIIYSSIEGGVLNLTIHYMRSLVRQGVPISIVNLDRDATTTELPEDLVSFCAPEPLYPTNVWCTGFPYITDQLDRFPRWAAGRWNINFTHWELPHIPKRLTENFAHIDSFIVDSEFVKDAIAEVSDKPIDLIDPEIMVAPSEVAKYDREYFGLPKTKVLFLLNWEFTSSTIRKNPEASLRAFGDAFDTEIQDVALVMHVKYFDRYGPEKLKEYQSFVKNIKTSHPGVIVLEKDCFSYGEALGLKNVCDVYVSLHRSEGYGMGCAESLALGRHCVMTAWSGNMVLAQRTEWLGRIHTVAADLIKVSPADFPWVSAEDEVEQFWADVKHEDAVAKLRQAYQAVKSV